jgi:predicted Zn finger-like uncharacterized protein
VKISCPTCAAKYSVADEKIQSRLAKIRCRKCSATIVIDGMTTPASVYIGDPGAPTPSGPPPGDAAAEGPGARPSGASPGFSSPGFSSPGFSSQGGSSSPVTFSSPAAAGSMPAAGSGSSEPVGPAADEYAVDIADNDQRNMTIHQIVGAYNEGLITADTYIWKEGMADWQTLAEVKPVADAIQAAARPVAPAAVRRAEQGSGPDLFGRIATAGSEDDISTSAPEPAISAGTGARNESSVLFSLSALTGSGDTGSSTGSGRSKSGRSSSDDSGLIDLTALTASDGANAGGGFGASASAYGASPLISAPLGGVSGPALGAGFTPGYGAPRSGGRTLLIAASVLAVAILGGAGLLFLNRGGGDTEPTTALEPAPAAAPAEKRPTEPEPAAAVAKPELAKAEKDGDETKPASVKDSVSPDELPTAAPEPVAKPAAARPAAPKPRPAPAPVARAKPTPPPAPEPEPVAAPKPAAPAEASAEPKKKPAGPRCDCKPADLMCAMRCSAKK